MNPQRTHIKLALLAGLAASPGLLAAPVELDQFYDPYFTLRGHVKAEGYLEFINPIEHPGLIGFPFPFTPPGVIMTEEYTGWTQSNGVDRIELGDSDVTAGDRADFDWVQENRFCETTGSPAGSDPTTCNNAGVRPGGVNHPGLVGAMGWTIGPTEGSPHTDPGTGAPHDDGGPATTHSDEQTPPGPLPHLVNKDYTRKFFNAVDVFPIISIGQDDPIDFTVEATLRAAALDYELAFGNTVTGAFSPGVIELIWLPGWTGATYIDNYVARWVPVFGGEYDIVAIEPINDQRTEIDAIKAILIPEPGTLALLGLGAAGLGVARRRAG